jgi:hypothetical protein
MLLHCFFPFFALLRFFAASLVVDVVLEDGNGNGNGLYGNDGVRDPAGDSAFLVRSPYRTSSVRSNDTPLM